MFPYSLAAKSTTLLLPFDQYPHLLSTAMILIYLIQQSRLFSPSFTLILDNLFVHSRTVDKQQVHSSWDLTTVKPTAQPGWVLVADHILLGLASTSESETPHPLRQPWCQAQSFSS